jgi:hypothetical protein
MNPTELIQAISVEDPDIDLFVRVAFQNEDDRDEIVRQMVTNPNIMVYYHCYDVASKASRERPDLFLKYWSEIAALLHHENSYHRDIALTILANLTRVDQDDCFSELFDDYFKHIDDKKFMTGKCCVQNSLKIIRNKPELKDQIIALLLDVDHRCGYPEKQMALLKWDVLDVLENVYSEIRRKKGADAFIRACTSSVSPKTKRKAKEMVVKFGL